MRIVRIGNLYGSRWIVQKPETAYFIESVVESLLMMYCNYTDYKTTVNLCSVLLPGPSSKTSGIVHKD